MTAVHQLRFQHRLNLLCKVLRVNRSTYYKHFHSKAIPPRISENQTIKSYILQICSEHDMRLGAYKIQYLLRCDYCVNISIGRVYRLMNSLHLPRISTRKPPKTKYIQPLLDTNNILKQAFTQSAPNLVWCSDITYLRVQNRFYYLCVIIDLFSRKVISYKLSSKADAQLVIDTFFEAFSKRGHPQGLLFHSDRGVQYTALAFRKVLDNCHVVQSFSKRGHPYDNAVAECFFKYLKLEETNRRFFKNFDDLKLSVFTYIDGYYNQKRPHSSLGLLTPNQFEQNFFALHNN